MFIREKRIRSGEYQEVDIIPMTDAGDLAGRGKRGKKRKLSKPAQANLNDKNSRRYFGLIAKGNFGMDDYYVTLTFSNKYLPKNVEEAKKILKNFLRKLSIRYKKAEQDLKYVYVLEYQEDDEGNTIERVHFHLLINQGIDRDTLENCWSVGRGKKAEMIGRVTTRRIKPDSDGIQALINYLKKKPRWKKGTKSWSGSRNLTKPEELPKRDFQYTRRKVESYCLSNDLGYEELSRKYPDYHIISIKVANNELKGWHMYLEMIKHERKDRTG